MVKPLNVSFLNIQIIGEHKVYEIFSLISKWCFLLQAFKLEAVQSTVQVIKICVLILSLS